ncbi:MAG TPA: hypothetical protein VIV11_33800 [Kofleriaceae bacterium]
MSDRRGELVKLARVLDLEPDVLAQLALDADSLRTVRESLSATLFDASRPTLQRVAKASKLLPNGTAAKVGEHVFGPLLCARIVGLLAPDHAIDLTLRLPDGFLADTSVEVDPRQAEQLIAAMPADRVVAIAGLLVARGDFLTLARFVDYLSTDTIAAVIASIPDELALLHIATFVESRARLAELVGLIPPARLRAMIAAVGAAPSELWLEALALANQLDERWKATIGDLAAELDPAVLEAMVATARKHDAWDAVLPLVAAMSAWSQARFVELDGVNDPAVLAGLVSAADRLAMWRQLLPLAARMDPPLRQRLASVIESVSIEAIDRIILAAHDRATWLGALATACELPPSGQQRVMQRLSVHFEARVESLADAAQSDAVWRALLLLVPYLPRAQRDRLANTILAASGGKIVA